jgi:RNA polymerase sigma-70 factor (ECF subfamily)
MKRQDFEQAALPHLNDLYRTATRLLADSTKADDVVQDVFLQAWKSFHRFEVGTNCRAWLYKILFHVVHHHRRKWFNVRMVKDSEEILDQVAVAAEPILEHLTDGEILWALDRIPQDFRAVVLLVDVDEFSYKEASAILNVPIGTVMSRLSRGRKLLREQLAETAQSYGIGKGKLEGRTA